MPLRIFTIPFSEETGTFHDDLVQQFCLNKRVQKIETNFFKREGQPYWTVAVHYGTVLSEEAPMQQGRNPAMRGGSEFGLDEAQKVLMLRLREWRKEAADKAGFPVYLIATNAQFAEVIKNRCTTLESLKLVKGFGKSKIEKYGEELTGMIRAFYETSS